MMGLGDADPLDDGDGRGGDKSATAAAMSCSICFDAVLDNGDRSWAKLQCGHQFHLDCIGSAFNVKGAMQCPNCRKIEKGQWLYANGNRPLPDFSMDDWAHDDDLYGLSYSEMSFGVHWCPFSGLTRLPSSFEGELESTAYHELIGHHALFPEHTPVTTFAYLGPIHLSSSPSNGSSFNNHWSAPSLPSEVPSSYVHYHNWDHSSDIPRPGMHPFIVAHSSNSRALSSVTSPMHPPFPVARHRDHPPSAQPTYFQQSGGGLVARTSLLPAGLRSNSHRGLAQVAPPPMAPSSDQSTGFYFLSSNSSSSGRTFQEAENPRNRYHNWEREPQMTFPLTERDSIWGPFHPPGGARHRYGSDRTPSQNRS